MYPQLKNLLHDVVQDEDAEEAFTAEDDVIPGAYVANQFDCSDLVGSNCSASRWEFNHQPERAGTTLAHCWTVTTGW